MRYSIFTIIFLIATFFMNAQKIEIKKKGIQYNFFQNEKKLNLSETLKIFKTNKKAFKPLKSAVLSYRIAAGMSTTSAVMLGISLGNVISGKKANWSVIGIGLGLSVASFPIVLSGNKKAKKAVAIYNSKFSTTNNRFKPIFKLNLKINEFGIVMRF